MIGPFRTIQRLVESTADPVRLDLTDAVPAMKAVVTTGVGGLERLEYRDVPLPIAQEGEVLLRVLAAGVNMTDINTRLGWYARPVNLGTSSLAASPQASAPTTDEGWHGTMRFPIIQGADCCGRVVHVGKGVERHLLGRRVLVRPCMRPHGFASLETVWMGSDFDGAFAEFVKVPATEVFTVESDLTDAELGVIPTAYGTAENMLRRAGVTRGQHVVITGASGGVGSAAVQLAKRRGAVVTAITGGDKAEQVRALGADHVVERGVSLSEAIGEFAVDAVIDNVSGPSLDQLIAVLKRGGKYVSSGAVAGPVVTFDKRVFYLRDLTFIGCTAWDKPVFGEVVSAVESGEVRPHVAGVFPLARIADAQTELLTQRHVGKFAVVPEAADG